MPLLAFEVQFSSTCEQLLFELLAAMCIVGTVWFVTRGDVFCTVLDQFFHMLSWPVNFLLFFFFGTGQILFAKYKPQGAREQCTGTK